MCVWWNFVGMIHLEFDRNESAVDANLYSQQLERVHEILGQRYPALVNLNRVFLQQDNVRPHEQPRQKLRDFGGIQLLPQPAYSNDSCTFRFREY